MGPRTFRIDLNVSPVTRCAFRFSKDFEIARTVGFANKDGDREGSLSSRRDL